MTGNAAESVLRAALGGPEGRVLRTGYGVRRPENAEPENAVRPTRYGVRSAPYPVRRAQTGCLAQSV